MKTIFSTCPYSQARTNEFFTLANQILQAAETMLTGKTEAQSMIAAYKTTVEAFDAALKQSAKNSYTASVVMADEAVDQAWSDMWGLTKAMVRHPNLERRKASAAVYDLMQKYGNVTNLSYKEEYGRLKNLSQDLEALGTEQLGLAYVDEWFEELKKRIATYETAEAGRLAEEDARQVGVVKATRQATEDALRLLLRQIEALVLINGEAGYTEFIARVNTLFSEMKTVIKSRQTKAANKPEDAGKADTTLPSREPDPEIAPGLNNDEEEGGGTPGEV